MMRTIGFLAGIGLTVAAFLLVLAPRENPRPEVLTATIPEPTAEELSLMVATIAEQVDVAQADTESHIQALPAPVSGMIDNAKTEPETGLASAADDASTTPDDQLQNEFEASGVSPDKLSIDQAASDKFKREDSRDTGTYMFWSPFHSTWAAQGFAGRLTLATQVLVDVVNTGPGKYRVAFSFQDEAERLARIERIETITGLKLE